MQRYIARRVLHSIMAILAMSVIVFALARVSGNPLDVMLPLEASREDYERVSKHWGLDQPLITQYFIFLGKALGGDFGYSWKWPGHSAMGLVWQRLPATLQLAGFALLISVVIALPIGVLAAVMKGTVWDSAAKIIALLGQSLPAFWLGMVIILALVSWLQWIPPVTYVGPRENFWLHAVQFGLPALAVGYRSSALIMRITRSALLEVMREDYIRTAWAKGQSESVVIWRHALKNAILPVVTVIGIEFAFLIGGLVVTENVFNLPGVARFLVQAILWRDYPIVQNLVMFIAVVVILSNLLVDMLYGVLDPRVRYGS